MTVENFGSIKDRIKKILFLGDILVSFGDFLYSNRPLAPSGYVEEWWAEDLQKFIMQKFDGDVEKAAKMLKISKQRITAFLENPLMNKPDLNEAIVLSREVGVPLHPTFTYFWSNLNSIEMLAALRKWLCGAEILEKDGLVYKVVGKLESDIKRTLELLCLPHKILENKIIIEGEDAGAFACCLGYKVSGDIDISSSGSINDVLHLLSGIEIRTKASTFVGARMGRPEKAKRREMKPLVHALFPVGLAGGSQRDIVEAAKKERVFVEVVKRKCPNCKTFTFGIKCSLCGSPTVYESICPHCGKNLTDEECPICKTSAVKYQRQVVNFRELLEEACIRLGVSIPKILKGVKGLTNETKTPESH